MRQIGAHLSVAGGFVNAATEAARLECDCAQVYVGPPDEWKVDTVERTVGRRFQAVSTANGIDQWIVMGKPLVDLATPDQSRVRQSLQTIERELAAAQRLGADYYVVRPGTHAGTDERDGLDNVSRNLSTVDFPEDLTLLLENTSGDGTTVGHRFSQIGRVLDESGIDDAGLCLDTCHAYAAGYDLTTRSGVATMLDEVERSVGIENLHLVHLNDAEHELGSKRGTPRPVGRGTIGREPLERLVSHDWFSGVPVVFETETDATLRDEITQLRTMEVTH